MIDEFIFIVGYSYNYIEIKDDFLMVVFCGISVFDGFIGYCIVIDECLDGFNVIIDGNFFL